MPDARIVRLLERRKAIVDRCQAEGRERLSTEEDADFRAYTERIDELREDESREQQVTEGAAVVRRAQARHGAGTESGIYAPHSRNSYFRDLVHVGAGYGPRRPSAAPRALPGVPGAEPHRRHRRCVRPPGVADVAVGRAC